VVSDEKMINAATAVSGSGPAFFCAYIKEKINAATKREEFIKKLADAAVGLGFDQQEARVISEKTVDGTIAILEKNNLSTTKLIKMVASKGGTTEAGLAVLEKGGSVDEAIKAAVLRAEELGRGN
jgi:pyrroline-5-carboxylate reductase